VKYLLDANIVILALSGMGEPLLRRLAECEEGDVVTSSIAYAEVALGSARGKPPPPETLRAFVEEVAVLSFDFKAAQTYAELPFRRASFDRLIAAHALSEELTLVTDNVRHYADVERLCVENWTQS
jgi:tRNA(fMet)-specific endonuclease VapC